MIEQWRPVVNDTRFALGPTIPYIIGAMRLVTGAAEIAPADSSKSELRALLVSMRDEMPPSLWIAIQPCPTLEEFIAREYPVQPRFSGAIESPVVPLGALYYAIGSTGHDVDSLTDVFWTQYEEIIQEGQFSRNVTIEPVTGPDGNLRMEINREWIRFDEDERREIKRTFADPDHRTRHNAPIRSKFR